MVDKVNHFVDKLPLNCCVLFMYNVCMWKYSVLPKKFNLNVNTTGFFAHTLKLEPPYETLLYTLVLIKGIKF